MVAFIDLVEFACQSVVTVYTALSGRLWLKEAPGMGALEPDRFHRTRSAGKAQGLAAVVCFLPTEQSTC